MLRTSTFNAMRSKLKSSALVLQAAVLVLAGFAPVLITGNASAEQLTSRSVSVTSSRPTATGTGYNFTFSWSTSTNVQGVLIQFCDTPLGSCVLPGTGTTYSPDIAMDISGFNQSAAATGFPNGLAGTPVTASTNDCSDASGAARTMVCLVPSSGSASGTGSAATISLGGITNPGLPNTPAANNTTVYARISVYTNSNFSSGSKVHEGAVATSINQQLTVNGRVQERLNFCVAAIDDGGATDTTIPSTVAACASELNTVVDLGIIDNTAIAKAPVDNTPPSSQGNDRYGIAMVNTNASNGVSVTYYAEPDSGGTNQLRAFRVPSASCSATTTVATDQCFQSAPLTSGNTLGTDFTTVPTNEYFGLNVPCIANFNGGTPIASLSSTTSNLAATTVYASTDTGDAQADCENADTGTTYAWNDTGTAATIASSSSVVDNEIVKLKFAARAAATTPTGSYTVTSTYIATPVF